MADDTKARQKAQREQRLQAALRENLRRRKAQARGRAAEQGGATEAPDSAQNSGPEGGNED